MTQDYSKGLDFTIKGMLEEDRFEGITINVDDAYGGQVSRVEEIGAMVESSTNEWAENNKGFWIDPMTVEVGFVYMFNSEDGWYFNVPAGFIFDLMGWSAIKTKSIEEGIK